MDVTLWHALQLLVWWCTVDEQLERWRRRDGLSAATGPPSPSLQTRLLRSSPLRLYPHLAVFLSACSNAAASGCRVKAAAFAQIPRLHSQLPEVTGSAPPEGLRNIRIIPKLGDVQRQGIFLIPIPDSIRHGRHCLRSRVCHSDQQSV